MFLFLTEIFCSIDDFCKQFDRGNRRFILPSHTKKRQRLCKMSISEIMTILILFHNSNYRTFKYFYLNCVLRDLREVFPNAVSYQRFVQLIQFSLLPLTVFLNGIKSTETGLYYVDSTSIKVCHTKREKRHKVFKGLATKGKNSMGWFFGFKLHLVINNLGELMSCKLTRANVDDRTPVPDLVSWIQGWLFGDKGYLGQEFLEKLKTQSIDLFTRVRKNMKDRIISSTQEYYLGKRGLVETVIDQLKNCCQIEHSRHRKPENAFANLISGLIAYSFKPRKPSISTPKILHNSLSLMPN